MRTVTLTSHLPPRLLVPPLRGVSSRRRTVKLWSRALHRSAPSSSIGFVFKPTFLWKIRRGKLIRVVFLVCSLKQGNITQNRSCIPLTPFPIKIFSNSRPKRSGCSFEFYSKLCPKSEFTFRTSFLEGWKGEFSLFRHLFSEFSRFCNTLRDSLNGQLRIFKFRRLWCGRSCCFWSGLRSCRWRRFWSRPISCH